MKKNIYKKLIVLLGFFLTNSSFSQTFIEELNESYNAKVEEETALEISNQYGDINFTTWEKDSVKINISIRIESKNKENIAKAKKGLGFSFDYGKTFIRCATKYTGDGMALGYRGTQSTHSYKHIIIDYEVFLPKGIELEINNRFGNVYMVNHEGKLKASVSHGTFKARKLSNADKIEVKYGKLKVTNMGNADLKLTGVKSAEILNAGELNINSTSSDIEIENVKDLYLVSKHDEIFIEEVNKCKGETSLTHLKIDGLKKKLILETKLGSVKVKDSKSTVSDIDIYGTRTDVDISFDDQTTAKITLEADDKKHMSYGMLFSEIESMEIDKGKVRSTLFIGEGKVKSSVKIFSSKGFIDLSVN